MDLKPEIWISSTNHIKAFDTLQETHQSWKKYFGFYNVPDDFPFMKQLGARIPIVYFSKGEVSFKDDKLHYNALKEKNKLLMSYCSLDNDLSFVLNHSNIKSIGWCLYERKSLRKFKWNWIRITCNEDILGGDFLICADGVGNTKKLFEMLNQFKEGQNVSTSLNDYSNSKIPMIGYIGLLLLIVSSVLNLIITATYGTINDSIWGPIAVLTLLLSFILIFTSMGWYLTKINENSKIQYHGLVFMGIMSFLFILNSIILHFFP